MLGFSDEGILSKYRHQHDIEYECDCEGEDVSIGSDPGTSRSQFGSEISGTGKTECTEVRPNRKNPSSDPGNQSGQVPATVVPVSALSTLVQSSNVDLLFLYYLVVSNEDSSDRSQDGVVVVQPAEYICAAGTEDPPGLCHDCDNAGDDNTHFVGNLGR